MGSNCTSGQIPKEISLTELNALSHYSVSKRSVMSSEQEGALKSIFPSFHTIENVKDLYFSLANSTPPKSFIDSNFVLTEQKKRLSQLYHFQDLLMSYFNGLQEDLSFFQQQNIELGYLSVVFYIFVKEINLLRKVLETKKDNIMGIYGFNFYCNGRRQLVIVDDFIPIIKTESIAYSRIHKSRQVWPLMMEKAWCKLTGGYGNALGLSPECAFEEITGIPAYTFIQDTIPENLQSFITRCLKSKYWVCLVAKIGVRDIENRHVFYLEGYERNEGYKICSPFMNYKLKIPKDNVHRVNLTAAQLLTYFQYFIVGYWHEGYQPRSIEVHSAPRQSIWLKILVPESENISIRFSQYYKGYLSPKYRDQYKYSPVQMELYDESTGQLVSEGCQRAQGSSKSVYMFENIFKTLQGTYYLRISVDWLHQNIMNGNLVIYSKQPNIQATILKDIQTQNVCNSVYEKMVSKSETKVFSQCQAEVRSFETKGQTVIVVKNLYQRPHTMAIELCEAENVEIKNTVIRGKKAIIRFETGESTKCLEISYANYLLDMKIGKILVTEEKK